MLSCLFAAVLWSPAGLSCVLLKSVFVTFPCGILGKVWYLGLPLKEIISYHREEILPLPHWQKGTQLMKIANHFSGPSLIRITFQFVATPLSYCTFSVI